MPEVVFDGLSSLLRAGAVALLAGLQRAAGAGLGDGSFEMVEQGVEVHRDDGGGADAGQFAAVVQPAGGEVPAAFRAGPQVAIDLARGALRGARGGRPVLQEGLLARCVTVVPVAVQQAAVGQFHHVQARLVGAQPGGAFHPVGVFLL